METPIFEYFLILKIFLDIVTGPTGSSPALTTYTPNGAHTLNNTTNSALVIAENADGVEKALKVLHYSSGIYTHPTEIPTNLSGPVTYTTIDHVQTINGISNSTVYSDLFPTNRITNQGNGTDVELRVFNPITENVIGSVTLSSAYNLTSCPDGFDIGYNNATGVQDLAMFVSNGNLATLSNNLGTIEWEEIIPNPDPGGPINPGNIIFVDQPIIPNNNNESAIFKNSGTALSNNGGYVYFTANHGADNNEIWISDGTPEGTYMIKDIHPNWGSYPTDLTAMNGKLYFIASSDDVLGGLWVTDGTESGTELIKDFNPGASSSAGYLRNINNKLYFRANDGTNGTELWISDGTTSGTMMVKDIYPGNGLYFANSSYPRNFTLMNGLVYFRAEDGINGDELWVTDGTENGTYMVKNINNTGDGSQGSAVNLSPGLVKGSLLYFYADDGVHGKEIWVTDGTREGTKIAYDLNPGPDHSNEYSQWGQLVAGDLIVCATDGVIGREVFIFDDVPSSCPSTSLALKVFLEGTYNTGSMTSGLSSQIPLKQPFNNETWEYYGDEETTTSIISSSNIVDWVLVELREGSSATDTEPIARKAALLKGDGTVIDSDGSSEILFKWVLAGDYYVSVLHRNHLSVLSSSPVTLTNL